MKTVKVPIELSKAPDFHFGNCAPLAIGSAFNTPIRVIEALFLAIGVKHLNNGVTFWECKKIIGLLSKAYREKIVYTPNPGVTYSLLAAMYNKGTYLVVLDMHVSHLEDGVIYDTYLTQNKEDINNIKPIGWWKIR